MSTAARTRTALREHPFVALALRAGVLNYRATARFLDCGEIDAVAAALRRHGQDASESASRSVEVRVRLRRQVDGPSLDGSGLSLPVDPASMTDRDAVIVSGTLPPTFVPMVLAGLALRGIEVRAHAATAEEAVFVVPDGAGADTLRAVEEAAEAVPVIEPI